jgi:hypothetical protein
MPLTSTPASRSPFASIISLMMNGAAPETSGIFCARATTSRYSSKFRPYLSTSTCALTPRTLSRNSRWKPEVIDMTASSAATPSATPAIAMTEITETLARFLLRK